MNVVKLIKKPELRFFFLFALSCFVANYADIPGFGLLLIGLWMQIGNVLSLNERNLTKKSQIFFLKYFLACIPLILILGGVNGFFPVVWKNFEIAKLILISLIQWIGCFLICTFMIFVFSVFQDETSISSVIVKIIDQLKNHLRLIVQTTLVFWTLNLVVLIYSNNDYLFVLNYSITFLICMKLKKMRSTQALN